ncbi:MAG: 1-acyl-sn-glycerol-3-phosphate acyltransferase [Bacteroidota bacterium]
MIRWLCKTIIKLSGWKIDETMPIDMKKCLVIAAPHTSNWDFWYCMAAFRIYRLRIRFTVKKEWMKFPYSILMKPLGGIAIDRSPKMASEERISHTDAMINLFNQHKELIIVFTPEGTRSRVEKWKTGFYHVAVGAGIPICLAYCDYKKKLAGIAKVIYPTDFEKDMREIMAFYKTINAKFPENFSVDTDFG